MIIIKIGGGEAINLRGIIEDLARLEEPFIIVHGANALRDELARRLNQPRKTVTSVSGYSSVFSDEAAVDLQMMAYAGLRNKRLVEMCQQCGINAVGLSGMDGGVIRARRNRGIKVWEGTKKKLLRDFSGKPVEVNRRLLDLLLDGGYTPVLSVPLIDEKGVAVNSENDDIVTLLQKEFKVQRIMQFIEAPGFLEDAGDSSSLINRLTRAELEAWEERVEGRIKRKLHALVKLLEQAPTTVHITDGRLEKPVTEALNGSGTIIEAS